MPSPDPHGRHRKPKRGDRERTGSTVRVTESTRTVLRDLSDQTGDTIQELVAKAVEAYRRERILKLTNDAYAGLRSDPTAWQEELDEREQWDRTLSDIIEDE